VNRAERMVWKLDKLGYVIHWPLPGEHTAHIFPKDRSIEAAKPAYEITHAGEAERAQLVENLIERLTAEALEKIT